MDGWNLRAVSQGRGGCSTATGLFKGQGCDLDFVTWDFGSYYLPFIKKLGIVSIFTTLSEYRCDNWRRNALYLEAELNTSDCGY